MIARIKEVEVKLTELERWSGRPAQFQPEFFPPMSTLALPQVETISPAGPPKQRFSPWKTWGAILLAPYVLVFIVFVLYPVGYGLWLARHPQSYVQLVDDPVFAGSVVNTLIFLIVAINIKMVVE